MIRRCEQVNDGAIRLLEYPFLTGIADKREAQPDTMCGQG